MSMQLLTNQEILGVFADRLKTTRLNKNITQKELANKSGLGLSSVMRFESGENISMDSFIKIVRALGLVQNFSEMFVHKNLSIAEMERIYTTKNRKRATEKKVRR